VARSPPLNGGGKLFQTLLEAFQGLGLDHGAHLTEAPHERAALLVVEFSGAHLAIHAACLGDDATQRMQGLPDEGALAALLVWFIHRGGGLYIFVFLRQRFGSFSLGQLGARTSALRAMQTYSISVLTDGCSPVANADAFGRQAAQERLSCPFCRGGVVLAGGECQGVGHSAREAQAKFLRIPGDRCHFANSICCGTSMPTTCALFAEACPKGN
jgi:hypothetical protein